MFSRQSVAVGLIALSWSLQALAEGTVKTGPAHYTSIDQVPAEQREAWWFEHSKKSVVKIHPLATIGLAIVSIGIAQETHRDTMIFALPLELEWALIPNASLFGWLSPLVVSSGTVSNVGVLAGAGVRAYWTGNAPQG